MFSIAMACHSARMCDNFKEKSFQIVAASSARWKKLKTHPLVIFHCLGGVRLKLLLKLLTLLCLLLHLHDLHPHLKGRRKGLRMEEKETGSSRWRVRERENNVEKKGQG